MNLADLLPKLEGSGLATTLEGNVLTAQHGPYAVRAEAVVPEERGTEDREIVAVVRITSGLPESIAPHLGTAETVLDVNRLSAFGALTLDAGHAFVGSRLTIYKGEEAAWTPLHMPLVLFAMLMGSEPIVGGLRRQASGTAPETGASDWTAADLDEIRSDLPAFSECVVEGAVLSAECELAPDPTATGEAARRTALLQMALDQPHPELGGGLACVLQLPHRVADLARVCAALNAREMAGHHQPPHFGAWRPGSLGDNPAYVMFLPNALRMVRGIAINAAYWAMARARWADTLLVATPGDQPAAAQP